MNDNIEIRTTKDGRIFGIKDIRHTIDDKGTVTLKADIAGDMEAGEQYLKDYSNMIVTNVLKSWERVLE